MNKDIINKYYRKIKELKRDRNAIILAHYYQRPEVQDIADYVGDSLGLAQQAKASEAEVIVFCGVHFMAESAAILSPNRTVLLPELQAGCPMADMATADDLITMKKKYPGAAVVSYVNTTAAVKAESDICCTSSNAVKVVESLEDYQTIIFTPDRNLAQYVAAQTAKEIILWPGYCNTHNRLTVEDVLSIKEKYPDAHVVTHPECKPEVTAISNFVGSTAGMLKYVEKSSKKQFIIATEQGLLHALSKQNPDKEFYIASKKLVCPNMKLTTLPKIIEALQSMSPVVAVENRTAERAYTALQRMLNIK